MKQCRSRFSALKPFTAKEPDRLLSIREPFMERHLASVSCYDKDYVHHCLADIKAAVKQAAVKKSQGDTKLPKR